MTFKLPILPYSKDSLEPFISKETIEFHYEKHHYNYVNNLNKLLKDNNIKEHSLEALIKTSQGEIFDNASQIWNHNFYWKCLTPLSVFQKNSEIIKLIEKQFCSFESFKEKFTKQASTNFGSGWTWLIQNENNELNIVNTSNANSPIIYTNKILLVVDVWEHAYYIDYRNLRTKYLENFWKIVNWDFVNKNLSI